MWQIKKNNHLSILWSSPAGVLPPGYMSSVCIKNQNHNQSLKTQSNYHFYVAGFVAHTCFKCWKCWYSFDLLPLLMVIVFLMISLCCFLVLELLECVWRWWSRDHNTMQWRVWGVPFVLLGIWHEAFRSSYHWPVGNHGEWGWKLVFVLKNLFTGKQRRSGKLYLFIYFFTEMKDSGDSFGWFFLGRSKLILIFYINMLINGWDCLIKTIKGCYSQLLLQLRRSKSKIFSYYYIIDRLTTVISMDSRMIFTN